MGAPDILVNNAGIATVSLLQSMQTTMWDEMIRINLSSVFYCAAGLDHMIFRLFPCNR